MTKKNILVFSCKEQIIDEEGRIVDTGSVNEYCVRKPNSNQQKEGQKVYNRAFKEALDSGCILRIKLDDFMREQKIWDDSKQEKLMTLNKQITARERKLQAGGFDFDEAVKLAKETRDLRDDLRELVADRTDLDVNTAEGQADNARFNYLLSVCLVYNDTQQPVFNSMDDYLEKAGTRQATTGAEKFAQLWYNLDEDHEGKYEEVKFMREYGIMNNNNHFINENGDLVDSDGRLVNEEGHYILSDGSLCDIDGNPMDENGNYIIEEKKPFTKDGKVVQPKKLKTTVTKKEKDIVVKTETEVVEKE